SGSETVGRNPRKYSSMLTIPSPSGSAVNALFAGVRPCSADHEAYVGVTVTVNVFVAMLPAKSVARAVTKVVPIGKTLPDAGVNVTGTAPSLLSVAVALKAAVAPFESVAPTVRLGNALITGATVSG